MLFFNWHNQVIGLVSIALLTLTACSQTATQTEPPASVDSVVTTAPTNDSATNNSSTASLDEAAEKVENALDNHPTLRAFDLDANDEGGGIVLSGRVQTASQKQLAQTLAREIAPGVSIVNRIVL